MREVPFGAALPPSRSRPPSRRKGRPASCIGLRCIGGASLMGGKGSILGTPLRVVILGAVVLGAVILGAVVLGAMPNWLTLLDVQGSGRCSRPGSLSFLPC